MLKPSTIKNKRKKKRAVLKAVRDGERSLEALCSIAGYTPLTFLYFCREYDVILPEDILPYRHDAFFDAMISQGFSLGQMALAAKEASAAKHTMESVRQYINASGQHAYWIEKREEKKRMPENLSDARSSFVSALKGVAMKKAAEVSWAYYHAVDYYLNVFTFNRSKRLDDLITMFERYEVAAASGTKLSLEQLTEGTSINFVVAGRILKRQGIKPLYGNKEKTETSEEQKYRLDLAYGVRMSDTDISYFVGVNSWTARLYFNRKGHKKPKRSRIDRIRSTGKHICYRKASQAYEMVDMNNPFETIEKTLKLKPCSLQRLMHKRPELESYIIDTLRTLYPEKEVTRPYPMWKDWHSPLA